MSSHVFDFQKKCVSAPAIHPITTQGQNQSMDTEARNEVARLWRVYKTIHHLVNDRVCERFLQSWTESSYKCCGVETDLVHYRVTWFLNQNWIWIWKHSKIHLHEQQKLSTYLRLLNATKSWHLESVFCNPTFSLVPAEINSPFWFRRRTTQLINC